MRDNIETLENCHKRYMELNKLMQGLIVETRKTHKKDITITLTRQNLIDLANVLGDNATLLKREIREKAEILKEKSIQDIEKAKEDIEDANSILEK